MCALASRVDLKGVIGAGSEQEETFLIEVEGGNISVGFGKLEQLRRFEY